MVLSFAPSCEDYFEPLLGFSIQSWNFLRPVLQIAIHYDSPSTPAVVQSGCNPIMLPEIAAELHTHDSFIVSCQSVDYFPRPVAAAVLDEDNLEIRRHLLQGRPQPLIQLIKTGFSLVDGNNN